MIREGWAREYEWSDVEDVPIDTPTPSMHYYRLVEDDEFVIYARACEPEGRLSGSGDIYFLNAVAHPVCPACLAASSQTTVIQRSKT
jgi:hypothetical protein